MDELNRRNTETVQMKLKEMDNRIFQQQVLVNQLLESISSMSNRMNELEKMVLTFKVKITGNGASIT